MIRTMILANVLCIPLVAPASLFGQFDGSGNRTGSNMPSAYANLDARTRRALRERAVAAVGPVARQFVETLGEEAAVALLACSRPVAVQLAEFFASGQMDLLPRPRDLLVVIAYPRHRDAVALWAIQHAG